MDELVLRVPRRREPEAAWVADVLLRQWLGLPLRVEPHDDDLVELRCGTGCVRWSDDFLRRHDARWLAAFEPTAPAQWPLPDADLARRIGQSWLPRWFGDGRFEVAPGLVHLPIDITGSAFFMLSRYEEAAAGAPADGHGRYPGAAGTAARAGLALRPLVDEWVELLWWAIERVAPGLQRRARQPQTWVSCDVDAPYSPGARGLLPALRQAASHLVHERSAVRAGQALLNAAASRVGVNRFDPYDSFDWMLDVNERAGQRISFFFLSVRRPGHIDGGYELAEPRVAALLETIVRRGHEVGLHGSYGSADEPARLAVELDDLQQAVARAGGRQRSLGARQHYLRWRWSDSARALDALGVEFDSTLGLADVAGFRCGTSHRYPLFDLAARRALRLVERPLVLMEATVLSPSYLGLGCSDEAVALMTGLRESCRRFGGEFALLWHNSNFADARAREVYEALIQPMPAA